MQIILVSRRHSRSKTLNVSLPLLMALGLALLAASVFGFYTLMNTLQPSKDQTQLISEWQQTLEEQRDALVATKQENQAKIEALAVKTAQLQSRLLRLDALAERMATMAKLDRSEFDFSEQPAMGGPEEGAPNGESAQEVTLDTPDFHKSLDLLADQIDRREQQLEYMESLLSNRKLRDAGMIGGRPILKGWMSSGFGYRTDPFKGHRAWHKGVDFAGKMGSDIISVAAGVVTWADKRYGYGNLVQINHGNGYSTRYGHNSEIIVSPGDVVKKGQVIAKMGSSGRSTGAHVHFEVLKAGKSINPTTYINRQ